MPQRPSSGCVRTVLLVASTGPGRRGDVESILLKPWARCRESAAPGEPGLECVVQQAWDPRRQRPASAHSPQPGPRPWGPARLYPPQPSLLQATCLEPAPAPSVLPAELRVTDLGGPQPDPRT